MRRPLIAVVIALLLLPLATLAQAAPAMLTGAVKTPLTLDEATLDALPKTSLDISFETSAGTETGHYTGVLLADLIAKAEPVNAEGKNTALRHTLLVTGSDGYAVAIAFGEFDPKFGAKQILLAYDGGDGKAGYDHLRILVPGDIHGGRAVSDVVSIEVK